MGTFARNAVGGRNRRKGCIWAESSAVRSFNASAILQMGATDLALGPDLETDTISVAGEGRFVAALSVGTRDQLSMIFRLTLAEQLRSTVVLDDQLTQSDAQRMVWLRNLIRQTAANIQIIVFTCGPTDYLTPTEFKATRKPEHFSTAVRSVDLAQDDRKIRTTFHQSNHRFSRG